MKHNPNRFLAKISMLICCFTLFSAQPAQCGSLSDWLSGFMEWLAGLNGDNSSTGTGSGGGTTPADTTDTSGTGTTGTSTETVPPANTIAQSCANDSGNASSQYTRYGENLAMTLAQLTPEQRSRVFGGN